jgi:GDP-4-dehydro-6-deoxy-D-mannose reductase
LAGFAHVGESWQRPVEAFTVNALGTLHVLEGARLVGTDPRVLIVSSAEVYGAVTPDELPLTEVSPLRPVSPYAASKAAAELLATQAHMGRQQAVVVVRPFNHVGPGQSPTFVVPAFARRIASAVRDGSGTLAVGNLSARRDLTDVRDVVRAYRLLMERGPAGGTFNVCTGVDVAIVDLVQRMLELAGADLQLVVDPELVRPADVPVLRGDATQLRAATGWEPEIPLEQSLKDVLAEAFNANSST